MRRRKKNEQKYFKEKHKEKKTQESSGKCRKAKRTPFIDGAFLSLATDEVRTGERCKGTCTNKERGHSFTKRVADSPTYSNTAIIGKLTHYQKCPSFRKKIYKKFKCFKEYSRERLIYKQTVEILRTSKCDPDMRGSKLSCD